MRHRKYIFFFILLFSFQIHAQNVDFNKENFSGNIKGLKKALKDIKKGDAFFSQNIRGFDLIALQHYLSAYRFNPNNALLNYKIGSCYLNTHFKFRSLPYFLKAANLDSTINSNIIYLIGRAYHYNLEFDKAIEKYNEFLGKIPDDETSSARIETNKKIEECKTGKKLVANPVRIFIDNIGDVVNSQFEDFNPRISADEGVMLFTSRRPNTTGGKKFYEDALYFEDIYVTSSEQGDWVIDPENPGNPLNTEDHDDVVGISPDGQHLLVYRGYVNGGDLYTSDLEGNNWSTPKNLISTLNIMNHLPHFLMI
ncbi:hypothetical protein ACFLRZ_01850 [Bacteroidota bacterium]